jgi:hypothetical protein
MCESDLAVSHSQFIVSKRYFSSAINYNLHSASKQQMERTKAHSISGEQNPSALTSFFFLFNKLSGSGMASVKKIRMKPY